ncbi:MAG: ABC transporter permease [Alphaproteobacteria bacterium]
MTPPSPHVPPYGLVNWLGVWTFYAKEVRRFAKVSLQTIVAPMVTTLLFLAIFTLALGGAAKTIAGIPYASFLMPGLVMAAVMQNAFANTSSSVLISKIQGNIVDVLMPPLTAGELTTGYALAGMTRGIAVAIATVLCLWLFVPVALPAPWAVVVFGLFGALLLSLIGLVTGVWSEKFDHVAVVTNFVVTPLAFLSGTFYSVEALPPFWHRVAHWNPFFYLIDGFRYGFVGHAEAPVEVGLATLVIAILALWALAHAMIARGYKLKV